MKETLIGLLKLIICILMLMYAETHYFAFLSHIGLNVSGFTPLISELFTFGLYALMFFIVYLMYQHHLKKDLASFKRKLFPNILMTVAFFAALTIFLWVINYITIVLADSMEVTYQGLNFYNIFNQEFDLVLLSFITRRIILMPLMLVIVYVLGIYDLINSRKTAIFLTGLLAAGIAVIGMSGTVLAIIFNVIPPFTIFATLSYIYHKNNYNIWFSAMTFVLYSMFASLLIERIT